mmetsp:Transcript_8700/g.13134  ORF Transcript_8700/g.13134 Transcript_8700/m.13134 type:complete len:454 (+) Transcript_8700:111-1472(+)
MVLGKSKRNVKGNSGKARRGRDLKRVVIVFAICVIIIALYELTGMGENNREFQQKKNALRNAARHHRVDAINFRTLSEAERIDLVVEGKVHLKDLKISRGVQNDEYTGVMGEFCTIEWHLHKNDPSSYPMFRDLVSNSPSCEHSFQLDLKKIVDIVRDFDDAQEAKNLGEYIPYTMEPAGFVFHESRCGSTLAANSLAAMNPEAHRVYSESGPPVAAAHACGLGGKDCPAGRAAELLRDVIYLMGRTNDVNEKRLFFKIQSIGTKYLPIFLEAFPDTPWMYVYREPVQIMMSQLKQGEKRANCVHQLKDVPQHRIDALEKDGKDLDLLTAVEKCALHLSLLCESAVDGLFDSGMMARPVNYENLVNKLIDHVIPDHFKVTMTNEGRENILKVGSHYSKGRGSKQREWTEDSEQKEGSATPEIREAAKYFLQDLYEKMEAESQNEYYGVVNDND